MAKLSSNHGLGMRFCESIGIDPQMVASVTFTSKIGDVDRATIDLFVDSDDIKIDKEAIEVDVRDRRRRRLPIEQRAIMLRVFP